MLEGLKNQLELAKLEKAHLKVISPIVFGQPVWTMMNNLKFTNWSELKEHVEKSFGLRQSQLLDAFFGMRPAKGKSAGVFIKRVKDKRFLYQVSAD